MGPGNTERVLDPEVQAGLRHLRQTLAAKVAASDEFPPGYDPVRSYELLLQYFDPDRDLDYHEVMDGVKSRFRTLIALETGSPGVPPAERWLPYVDTHREAGFFDVPDDFADVDGLGSAFDGPLVS